MPADTKDPLLRSTLRLPELLFQAMEDAEVGVVILEAEHGGCSVVYVNEAFERITGADVGSSPGKPCRLVEPHGDERSASTAVRRVLATGEPCHVEFPTTLTDGRKAWIRFALSPITGTRGGTAQLLGLVQDITAAKVAQAQLEQSEYELRTIMTSVEEGIQLWDEEGRLIYANPASERQLGMVGGETDWGDGQQFVREDGTAVAHDDLPVHRALRTGQAQMEAMLHSNLDAGESKWIRMRAYPIRDSDSGRLRGAVTTTVDVTGNVEQEQRLARLAHYDALTQLPNRVLLSDRMRQAVARSQRTREVFAVGVMDLDGFKPVNDIYGHKAGDDVLCEVAQRVLGCLREGDTVARLGGDEFALLLTGLGSSKDSEWVLQRILAAVSAPYLVEGDVLKLSTSIGVTVYPGDLSDSDKLLRHADHAMYQAKQAGKNRIMFFDSTLETRFQANQGALRKISDALAKNQFELHYQPIVDCLQGRIVATEALIRWRHPVLGLLQPAARSA
jgi:diguanylate cyclase (GGDEF)-like protein/PAS domain S-box-containing protein